MELQLDIKLSKSVVRKLFRQAAPLVQQSIQFPDNWEDVPEDLLHKISAKLLPAQLGEIEAQKFIIDEIVKAGIQGIDYKESSIDLDFDTFHLLSRKLEWMFNSNNATTPFLFFNHKGTAYFMPADALGNTVMGELHWLDLSFRNYVKSKQYHYLLQLVAVIARPRKQLPNKYDKRRQFQPAFISERQEAFTDLDPGIVKATLNYFLSSLEVLDKHFQLFQKKDQEKDEDAISPNFAGKKKAPTWREVMMTTAEANLERYNQYFQTPTWEFMSFLKQRKQYYKKLEAQRAAHEKK